MRTHVGYEMRLTDLKGDVQDSAVAAMAVAAGEKFGVAALAVAAMAGSWRTMHTPAAVPTATTGPVTATTCPARYACM
eukprot:1139667-Pelagomonas_calceolata.AAC.6